MATYASNTDVSSEKSRGEIERILTRWGADEYGLMLTRAQAQVAFAYRDIRVRFILPLPNRDDKVFTMHSRGARTASAAEAAYEQAVRQKWRALALVIKAKLEAVESGISTFEHEFFAHIVLPDGRTVFESIGEQVGEMLESRVPGRLMLEAGS